MRTSGLKFQYNEIIFSEYEQIHSNAVLRIIVHYPVIIQNCVGTVIVR